MKIQHRIPEAAFNTNMTGRISDEYQHEVDRTTERLEREFAQWQRSLEAAEKRLARAERAAEARTSALERSKRARAVRVAWEVVEIRREELARLASLMETSPQSARHRGGKSFKPVPVTHGSRI